MPLSENEQLKTTPNLEMLLPFLRLLCSSINDILILADNRGEIIYVNNSITTTTGYSADELTGKQITELLHPDEISAYESIINNVLNNPTINSRLFRLRHKTGKWINVHSTINNHLNTAPLHAIIVNFKYADAEARLIQSEEKLRWLLEHSGDIIIELDDAFLIKYINHQVQKTLWYDPNELIGKPITFLSHSDDLTLHKRELNKIKNIYGYPIVNRYRLRRRDGNTVWFEGTVTNLLKVPSVNGIIINQRDISRRIEDEQKQSINNERHNMVLKATNDAVWEWSVDSDKLYWGDGFKMLFGYDVTDNSSETGSWSAHIHEEDKHRVMTSLYKAVNDPRQEKWDEEYRYIKANGKYAYVYDRGFIIRDENKKALRMIGAMQDITERKANEQMLRISNERYKIVSRATNDAIWDWNLLTNEVFWNGAVKTIFGFREEEVGYSSNWWMSQVHPDDRVKLQNAFKDVLSTGREFLQNEYRFMCSDGTYKYVFDRSYVIYEDTENGKLPIRMVGALQDITQRKMAEQEMKNFSLTLEKRVKERTAELESLNSELESFSYSVSHDLRAPLRSINGFSQAIIEDYYELLDEAGKQYLDRIKANSQRMASLIDDLLKLSQITRHQIKKEEINLSVMVNDIIERMREIYDLSRVTFKIQENLHTYADPKLMQIALTNLLDNALKFSHKSESPMLIFAQENTGAFLIKDNGIGFEVKYVNKVFEAFQRLQNNPEYPGTGIGLSIVHKVISRHGGSIWANSQPGKGATFYFTL
jgi:PAS domain S-box-containing protein